MEIESTKNLVVDLIPALHQLRISVLEDHSRLLSSPNQAALDSDDFAEVEVAGVMHKLMNLELVLGEYDNLCVVKALKSAIAEHINITTSFSPDEQHQMQVHVATLSHKQGLEPIRLKFLAALEESIACLETDDLLVTKFPEGCSSKKKPRGIGNYISFNLDDLPAFEPLELTLRLLRGDVKSSAALQKLMTLEVGELLEHPQWHELLSLLYSALDSCAMDAQRLTIVMNLHVRFMESLEGQQCIDLIINLLKFFWKKWGQDVTNSAVERGGHRYGKPSQLSAVSQIQVRCFMYALSCCKKCISYCSSQSADVVHATLFLLLARGHICGDAGSDGVLDTVLIPVFDAISYLDKRCSCGLGFARELTPIGVVTHAINSHLLPMVNQQLERLAFTCASVGFGEAREVWEDGWLFRRFSFLALIFFDITEPFHSKGASAQERLTSKDVPQHTWDGILSGAKPGAAFGQGAVQCTPVVELNKLISQLTGTQAVWRIFETSCEETDTPADVYVSTVSVRIVQMARSLHAIVTQFPVAICDYKISVLALVERIMRYASLTLPAGVQEQLLPCCSALITLLISADLETKDSEAGCVNFLDSYIAHLTNVTTAMTRDFSCMAVILLPAWASTSKLAFEVLARSKNKNRGESMQEQYAVSPLACQLFAGWQHLLRLVQAMPKTAIASLGAHAQFVEALGGMIEFAATCAQWRYQDEVHIDPDLEGKLTASRSACVIRAVSLILTITSSEVLVNIAIASKPVLVREVTEILLRCIIGDDTLIGETASEGCGVFQSIHLCSSIIVMCEKFGDAVMFECRAWLSLVEFVSRSTSGVHSWEHAEAWHEAESPLSIMLELLCGLAYSGHEALAFLIACRAWEPLQELCVSHGAASLTELLALGDTILEPLECESFYTVLLRVAQVALCSVSFVCRVKTRSSSTAGRTAREGIGEHSLFWSVLASRLASPFQIAQSMHWCPFFLPFSEGDLARSIAWTLNTDTLGGLPLTELSTVLPIRPVSLNVLAATCDMDIHIVSAAFTSYIPSSSSQVHELLPCPHEGSLCNVVHALVADPQIGTKTVAFTPLLRDALIVRDFTGVGEKINWLVAASHILGVTSTQQFAAILQRVGAETDTDLRSKAEQMAVDILRQYRQGTTYQLLSRLGVSPDVVVRSIASDWFFAHLCIEDVAFVTAATLAMGAPQAAIVMVGIVVKLGEVLRAGMSDGWGCVGGAEAVIRATLSPAFAKYRICDSSTVFAEICNLC